MPFEYILGNLLARNEGAVGALFFDDSGEAVDLACADSSHTEIRIVGAYVGIYLRQLERLTSNSDLGEPEVLQIAHKNLNIFAVPVEDGYCLALIQRRPALASTARRSLLAASEEIRQELFVR